MKNILPTLLIIVAGLCNVDTVTARPFSNSMVVKKSTVENRKLIRTQSFADGVNERDSIPFESEAIINTPFLTEDDNEPIRRDEVPLDSEALINTSIFSEDNNEPIKRDTTKNNNQKRQGSGISSIDVFGNALVEEKSDGSDDLFGGGETGRQTISRR